MRIEGRMITGLAAFSLLVACGRKPREAKREFREIPVPGLSACAAGLTTAPDGALWVADRQAGAVYRVETAAPYASTKIDLGDRKNAGWGIAIGSDGAVWVGLHQTQHVVRIRSTPPYTFEEYAIPYRRTSYLTDVVAGADGDIWVALGDALARIPLAAPSVITVFEPPHHNVASLATGPDGSLWHASGLFLTRRTLERPYGSIDLQLRGRDAISQIVTGPDGNIWYVRPTGNLFGRVVSRPPFTVSEFLLPKETRWIRGMVAGPREIYLFQSNGNLMFRISPSRPELIEQDELPAPWKFTWSGIVAGDGTAWLSTGGRSDVLGRLPTGALFTGQRTRPAPIDLARIESSVEEYVPFGAGPESETVVLQAEVESRVRVDDGPEFVLAGGEAKSLDLVTGRHVVSALGVATGRRFEKPITVVRGLQTTLTLSGLTAGDAALDAYPPVDPRIEFASLPAGEFIMGSVDGSPTERPRHAVVLSNPFQIGRYEVTQGQWAAVMGPMSFGDPHDERSVTVGGTKLRYADSGPKKPMVSVTPDEISRFLTRLDRVVPGYRHRLPTEAEWEYACRAGRPEELPSPVGAFAWVKDEKSWGELHDVGKKMPNGWGLFDMHGNASEWCSDWFSEEAYAGSEETDPRGPASGRAHVVRGGNAWNRAGQARCGARDSATGALSSIGFRVVRTPLEKEHAAR